MPKSTVHRPWTQDTGTAFLLALRLTGQVRLAAAEIGRVHIVCYNARRRDPAFAAAWDAILAEQRRAAKAEAKAAANAARRAARAASRQQAEPEAERDASGHRARWTGLNRVKQRAFLRGLSETGTVAGAARAAGVSDTAAYNLRACNADFATAWDRALRVSAPALEQVAYERAVEGWEEPVFSGGKQVGTRWRHSPQLLKQLIDKQDKAQAQITDPKLLRARAEEAARAAGGQFHQGYASEEETNAAIMAALARIDARERAKAAREAERLLALGLVP